MKASNETNHHPSSRAGSTIASSSSNMDHLSLGQLIQSLLRGDEDDHDMCQDIKKTVEEYMALNRAQLSVSERLLAVNEQLLASQLRLLEGDNNDAAASTADRHLMDTATRDSSAASKKNKAAAKKRRNKRNKAAATRKKTKHVPGLNGGIIPQILMVLFGSFMLLFLMSLIHTSDGSEGVSPPSLPPTTSLRRNIRQSRQSGISSSPPTLSMVESTLFSTSSSSSPNPSTDVSTSINNCVDTPNWKDRGGDDCRYYEDSEAPGCPKYGHLYDGGMGVARDNCCYCKKDLSCEDLKISCQNSLINNEELWVCDEAVSSCCGATDEVTVKTSPNGDLTTVGLYDKCKCDFWIHLCDTEFAACEYAAEFCCGDYKYSASEDRFYHLNSPECYCDYSFYVESEWPDYTLKPTKINVNKTFTDACGEVVFDWSLAHTIEDEKISLEAMYTRLGGDNWTRKDGWMNDTDHCQWFGISCDSWGYVTHVELGGNNLKGQFPLYTRNDTNETNDWRKSKFGLANLYNLVRLDLSNNNLTGTIDYAPLYNLVALKEFNISRNNLYGEADALVAPYLEKADFGNNNFTSMRRFENYKWSTRNSLLWCDASNNAIRQDAGDLLKHIPPSTEHFIASNNEINGSLPYSLNELKYLREFKVASNSLSGALPKFEESDTTLQELDVSDQKMNGLTGEIPEELWRTGSIKSLNLAGNRLTGTIPSLIGDLAVLKVFDVSNNLLEGPIPSEVALLAGSLKRLDLSSNNLSGVIPTQIGQLQGASVFLKGNLLFNNASLPAPLSLCAVRDVKEFDLKDDPKLCPLERSALDDFFDKAKGGDWLDGSMWLDEYESYCSWKGVTCDEMDHVIKLRLPTNGLSGILSESIANLTYLEELDLSNNDMKGPIPADLGLLSNLTYLRLSYNVFTGTAPAGLGEMKRLQLLQLQSNRITGMPVVPRINDSIHGLSTFVTDCGVPSDFDEALACENCTMCCNANDDCYPQVDTKVAKSGFKDYGAFSGILAALFFFFCCMVTIILNVIDKRRHSDADLRRSSMALRRLNDEKYALSAIGKDSVYKYFVSDNVFGWIAALSTIGTQIWILTVFVKASELNLQDDKIDIEFTWKCPRDTDTCDNKGDLDATGWAIFAVLMVAFLAKDLISGAKLIAHSAKRRHDHKSRLRYFFGGICLGWITLFILYVSTIYNKALATSNTGIIVNSVVILFIMDIDEKIFATLAAINEKWTTHAAESDDTAESSSKNNADDRDNMNNELAAQREQIAAQRDEIAIQKEQMATQREEMAIQREQMETQRNEMAMLRAEVQKIMQEAYDNSNI